MTTTNLRDLLDVIEVAWAKFEAYDGQDCEIEDVRGWLQVCKSKLTMILRRQEQAEYSKLRPGTPECGE